MDNHTPRQYGYITVSVMAILLNATVIYLFVRRKYLRNMYSNIFLFSLAISDFCYAAVAIPLLVRCEQERGLAVCLAYDYAMVFFGYSTVYHILLAITEKLCAICFTLKHHSMFSRSIAIKLSLAVWLLSLLFAHIPIWWDFIFPDKNESQKRIAAYYRFTFATAFVLPVLVSTLMYSIILHKIVKAANARLTEDHSQRARQHVEKKAALMFALMLAAFLFAQLPWFLARVHNGIIKSMSVYDFLTINKLLDPVFNPILYTFLKNDFRRALLALFRSKKRNNEFLRMALKRMDHRADTALYTHDDATTQCLQHSVTQRPSRL